MHATRPAPIEAAAAVPLKLYFKGGLIKIEFGLAKGKKLYDKRDTKKKKDVERDIQRALKSR